MSEELFDPQEQGLIERLQNAPQPRLRPAAYDAIRDRMLEAMDVPLPVQDTPTVPSVPLPIVIGIVGVVIIIAAVIIGVILSAQGQNAVVPAPSATPTLTLTLTATPQPSATLTPTVRDITAEASATATATITPRYTPTAVVNDPSIVVIEGPVETIDGNTIRIYNQVIQLATDDPILKGIQIGDIVRVEGRLQPEATTVVITVLSIRFVQNNVEINSQTGEVWRDNESCQNPPPPWANANGWRQRCEGGAAPGNSGNAPNHNQRYDDDDDDD